MGPQVFDLLVYLVRNSPAGTSVIGAKRAFRSAQTKSAPEGAAFTFRVQRQAYALAAFLRRRVAMAAPIRPTLNSEAVIGSGTFSVFGVTSLGAVTILNVTVGVMPS